MSQTENVKTSPEKIKATKTSLLGIKALSEVKCSKKNTKASDGRTALRRRNQFTQSTLTCR